MSTPSSTGCAEDRETTPVPAYVAPPDRLPTYFRAFLSAQPNWITNTVKLSSLPRWYAVRTTLFAASSGSSQCFKARSTTSWLFKTSKMPSVASTKKRSLSVKGMIWMSGSAIDKEVGCLKYKSPRDLVIAKPWYSLRADLCMEFGLVDAATRQAPRTCRTRPPARSIRFFSSIRMGLWSSEAATACPPRQRTARESPRFATTSRKAVPNLGFPWSNAATAVDPTVSNFLRSATARISLSV
mmetsp:Transcript_8928/g.24880  ORF Transcript_8928/g.24880 Transcript_8928/m.24880 type:complete len:241 (+) Transcript_8928:119-841(+)